jgi:drug/metabolite transporter (DMT)-like permease
VPVARTDATAGVRPAAALAAAAVLWGTIGVVVREVELPAVAIVAGRVWVGAAALGAWLALRGQAGPPLLGHRPARTLLSGAVLALHWVLLFAALRRAPIGTVLLITYLAPVAIAALAPRTLGERAGRRTVVALASAVIGMALLAGPTVEAAGAAGLALAGGSAALYVVLVLVGKPLAEAYGGPRLAFLQLAAAGVVLVPAAAAVSWGPPRGAWAWVVVLGLFHTALATGVFFTALARLPATQVGVLTYLEPASAVVFGWLLLSEAPGPATLVGGALIVAAGVAVVTAPRGRTAANPFPAEVADVPR